MTEVPYIYTDGFPRRLRRHLLGWAAPDCREIEAGTICLCDRVPPGDWQYGDPLASLNPASPWGQQ